MRPFGRIYAMRTTIKKLGALALIVICCVFLAHAAGATSEALSNLQTAAPSELSSRSNLLQVIGSFVKTVLSLSGLALILTVIYAGTVWGFMAQGDSTKIKKAQHMIINAVIGLLVVFGAWAIMTFVMDIAKKSTGQSARLPSQTLIVINK